jgi:hypothetical protein
MLEMLNGYPRFYLYKTCVLSTQSGCRGEELMAAQNNAPLPDGLEVAGYRIVKKIASGGFSIVYLAYDAGRQCGGHQGVFAQRTGLAQEGELIPAVSPANLPVFASG